MTPTASTLRVPTIVEALKDPALFEPTIVEALKDPALFEPLFRGTDWHAWVTCLATTFGLPLSAAELEIYRACAGRSEAPTSPVKELWTIVGRRGGKSRVAALIAVYLACFRRYESLLAPGEVATVMVIGPDRRQARTVMR